MPFGHANQLAVCEPALSVYTSVHVCENLLFLQALECSVDFCEKLEKRTKKCRIVVRNAQLASFQTCSES